MFRIDFRQEKVAFFSIHWTSKLENLAPFFEEQTDCLSRESESYGNFVILGDFSRDVKVGGRELNKIEEFYDLLNLTKLIRSPTCSAGDHKPTIDLILTNKSRSFQSIYITETGVSSFHKLILILLKTQITCLKPKDSFLP